MHSPIEILIGQVKWIGQREQRPHLTGVHSNFCLQYSSIFMYRSLRLGESKANVDDVNYFDSGRGKMSMKMSTPLIGVHQPFFQYHCLG